MSSEKVFCPLTPFAIVCQHKKQKEVSGKRKAVGTGFSRSRRCGRATARGAATSVPRQTLAGVTRRTFSASRQNGHNMMVIQCCGGSAASLPLASSPFGIRFLTTRRRQLNASGVPLASLKPDLGRGGEARGTDRLCVGGGEAVADQLWPASRKALVTRPAAE